MSFVVVAAAAFCLPVRVNQKMVPETEPIEHRTLAAGGTSFIGGRRCDEGWYAKLDNVIGESGSQTCELGARLFYGRAVHGVT